ncbi:MAG: T9SS type A sorting domain-containing protein [Chlorobi bacterium]|nr:T9SS type A sorting domain-containing protein [Chlorobiota bacterium]
MKTPDRSIADVSTLAAIAFLILSMISPSAFGKTYYVATTGNDANPGTTSQPWRTLTKAANTLVAGDTVFIRAGTYGEQVIPVNSGTAGNPIVYMNYPGDVVTIDGSSVSLPAWEGLFEIDSKGYITVSGLRIINVGPNGSNTGIQVEGSNHIIIKNNYTNNTASSGIIVWSSTDILVDNNEVVHACSKAAASINECISVGETSNFEVSNNYVHDGNTYRGEGIVLKDGSSNGTIHGNTVHTVPFVGIYVDAWDKYTHDFKIYNNTVHDVFMGDGISIGSEQGGLLKNIYVYNNISYHNEFLGISIHKCCVSSHTLNTIHVINNTVYNNGWKNWGGGITLDNKQAQNVLIRNNISSSNLSFQVALEEFTQNAVTVDYNLIDGFRNYPEEVYGDHYVTGDPQFVNAGGADFHLQNQSPAIDSGTAANAPKDDFDGVSRPQPQNGAWDIGAFEYIIVPVELASFHAFMEKRGVILRWATESETNNTGFRIERSSNVGGPWISVGFVPGAGTSVKQRQYEFIDTRVPFLPITSSVWYRLAQIDFDGAINYSPTLEVASDRGTRRWKVMPNTPNPFRGSTTISVLLTEPGNVRIDILDLHGRILRTYTKPGAGRGIHFFNWDAAGYPAGMYLCRVKVGPRIEYMRLLKSD